MLCILKFFSGRGWATKTAGNIPFLSFSHMPMSWWNLHLVTVQRNPLIKRHPCLPKTLNQVVSYYHFHFHSCLCVCVCAKSLQSCPTPCDSMDCSLPGSSVHGILQARILEWVAVTSPRGSSWPRDQTHISCLSCIGRRGLTTSTTWVVLSYLPICILFPILKWFYCSYSLLQTLWIDAIGITLSRLQIFALLQITKETIREFNYIRPKSV